MAYCARPNAAPCPPHRVRDIMRAGIVFDLHDGAGNAAATAVVGANAAALCALGLDDGASGGRDGGFGRGRHRSEQ
ncbi:uncharacterized protein SETTUDRAFT_160660 [Exserohilum turcica Et28A]|uniref:Uncharacterized protein n=1 Tax=Exserohilum turcicum (strain 28A) TaxID=671987 RepID=R0ITS8_EXST2|nr:uncharacterized protein SETTUDRAFT_160660 [Exserohilum turcica Et28A]EOA88180.1 hypothetical protein SETTUDRAFT_160660 [Exserohilum turcica Et28A]